MLFSLYPNKHSIYHKMGRLSTAVASVGVDAGNLPEKLPTISLWDALLPGSWSRKKVGRSHAIITCRPLRLIYFPSMHVQRSFACTINTPGRTPNPNLPISQPHSESSSHPHPKTKQKNINNSLSLFFHNTVAPSTSHPAHHHHQTCLSSSNPSSASPSSPSQ